MALIRYVLFVLLACFLFSSYNKNGVEGRMLSKEEDFELEKQLQLLNKPSIKTIQTEDGDIYNCVDFYKQPAFNHPLLKNHTFHYQMRPSSLIPKVTRNKKHSTTNKNVEVIKPVGCPIGTVPIRRTTKDDLVRVKLHEEKYGSKHSVLTIENPGTHYATVRTTFHPKKKYNGGFTAISAYNPKLANNAQYSSGRMKIQNGMDSIQVGWTVSPTLYGHNRTHLYIHLNSRHSRCFNLQCPGFIMVNAHLPVDSIVGRVSERGGEIYVTDMLIFRDRVNGNWWLGIGEDRTLIGFWPQRIFSGGGLADMAINVEWGGEVFSPPNVPSPPMGSGTYQEDLYHGDTRYDAFCELIATVNDANEVVDAVNTQKYVDSKFYAVTDEGNVGGDFRHLVFFGGPGGATGIRELMLCIGNNEVLFSPSIPQFNYQKYVAEFCEFSLLKHTYAVY